MYASLLLATRRVFVQYTLTCSRAVLPIYSNGKRVEQSVTTNSGTLQKLTLSNIDKGSGVYW